MSLLHMYTDHEPTAISCSMRNPTLTSSIPVPPAFNLAISMPPSPHLHTSCSCMQHGKRCACDCGFALQLGCQQGLVEGRPRLRHQCGLPPAAKPIATSRSDSSTRSNRLSGIQVPVRRSRTHCTAQTRRVGSWVTRQHRQPNQAMAWAMCSGKGSSLPTLSKEVRPVYPDTVGPSTLQLHALLFAILIAFMIISAVRRGWLQVSADCNCVTVFLSLLRTALLQLSLPAAERA